MSVRSPTEAEALDLVHGLAWPADLIVGAASAGYQCEGGYNVGDGPRNNWAEWEGNPGNERTGPAARFWDFPERDLRLAQAMGLNAHRLSIEWARVQPVRERKVLSEAPPWDWAAVDRYVELLVMARSSGLEPVVTLQHFTHPYWTGLDLWQSEAGVDQFIVFVDGIVPALNERLVARGQAPVRTWITLNEPNVLGPASYLARWMPSGTALDLGSPGRFVRALDCLYSAHVRAYGAIHRCYASNGWPTPRVSFNNFALDFYEADRLFVDLMLAPSAGVAWGAPLQRYLDDRKRTYNQQLAPLIGRARRHAPERWLAAHGLRAMAPRLLAANRFPLLRRALEGSDWKRPLDYVGIDYYDATLANQLKMAAGKYDPWEWEAIPEGLFEILRANGGDGLPVLIAENGMATRRVVGGKGEARADGLSRPDFLRAHLFQMLRAMKAGVTVMGYLHWSLTDNYEWGRFSPRFGLHGVDYSDDEKRRLPVDAEGQRAAAAFASIARALVSGDTDALASALSG